MSEQIKTWQDRITAAMEIDPKCNFDAVKAESIHAEITDLRAYVARLESHVVNLTDAAEVAALSRRPAAAADCKWCDGEGVTRPDEEDIASEDNCERCGGTGKAAAAEVAATAVPWDRLPGWLIDHREGEEITEEGLQRALGDMLKHLESTGEWVRPAEQDEDAEVAAGLDAVGMVVSAAARAQQRLAQESAKPSGNMLAEYPPAAEVAVRHPLADEHGAWGLFAESVMECAAEQPAADGETSFSGINTYRHRFNVQCPNNEAWISYDLEISSPKMLMVEKILLACSIWKSEFHEKVADGLMHQFPGTRQILKAHHHGVDIETHRGALTTEVA